MTQNQRLLIALIISLIILTVWQNFIITPETNTKVTENNTSGDITTLEYIKKPIEILPREHVIQHGFSERKRILLESDTMKGSLSLIGGRLDDVILKKYTETADPNSQNVVLLSPGNTNEVFFVEFGWLDSSGQKVELPTKNSVWQHSGSNLSPMNSINMYWKNSTGITFKLQFSLDEKYMLNIKQSVQNNSGSAVSLHPYFAVNRTFTESKNTNMLMHEGAIGVLNSKLHEVTFGDIKDDKNLTYKSQSGWLGWVDKYWLTAIIPQKGSQFNAKISSFKVSDRDRFQIDGILEAQLILPNNSIDNSYNLFIGPKQFKLLESYEKVYNIELFDRAVDFGILYFITKPIFMLLSYFYQILGNFGYAIILLTIVIKLLLFPLSYKSFLSMNKLKALQPQMAKIKEKFKDDMQGMHKAMMELYKKENANPMSGCLPIIVQMPIFFALYKVLYVTIEMRHAPFMLWIHDLSAPDPTSLFNMFGLIPWDPPGFLMIGVLPIIMALTMHIQQKLNPEPSDPTQAKVMKMLPLIFLFMFASFPSGLVLYWAWSNILSILQQAVIKKLHSN